MQIADPTASATWVFANLSFTGMYAQNTGSTFWKVVSFIFGFPGTLLTMLIIERGSERAYGVDLPRKRNRGNSRLQALYEMRDKPLTYKTGDEIKKDDRIVFKGESGRVEFVAVAPGANAELTWYVEQYGRGAMIDGSKGRYFLTLTEGLGDLVFISRAQTSPPSND
jgi:hypothetical protein